MTNQEVIIQFLRGNKAKTPTRKILNGYYQYTGNTLTTDGKFLTNYSTIIAYKEYNKLYINKKKYSITTSHIQSKLNYLATKYYKDSDIIYYEVNDRRY